MFDKIYSQEELQQEAEKLSHYEGDAGNMPLYTGEGDDLLSFVGRVQNFASEGHDSTQFTFVLTNNGAETRTAVLWAGYQNGDSILCPGQISDGAFTDINGDTDLVASATNSKTIRELKAYLNKVPSRIVQLRVVSPNSNQISNDFTISSLSPFDDGPSMSVKPKNLQTQNVEQLGVIVMPTDMPADHMHKITYPVLGNTTVTVSFFFGASINLSNTLEKRASEAIHNVSRMGARKVALATARPKRRRLS